MKFIRNGFRTQTNLVNFGTFYDYVSSIIRQRYCFTPAVLNENQVRSDNILFRKTFQRVLSQFRMLHDFPLLIKS